MISPWGISRFLDDLQGYYLIAFRPADPSRYYGPGDGAPPPFHRLKIRVKRKGLHVRYHAGYVGWSTPKEGDANEGTTVEQALASPFSAPDIRLRLTAVFNQQPHQGSVINVLLHVNAHDVAFTHDSDGRHQAALEMVARTIDENSVPAESVKKVVSLRLQESNLQRAMDMGLLYQASIAAARPGYYEVRIVLRDNTTKKLGSAREYVEVPNLKNGRLAISGLLAYSPDSGLRIEGAPGMAALRQFDRRDTLNYACQLFNAATPIQTQARVFRYGKQVVAMPPAPATVNGGAVLATGAIPLATLEPGSYVLQVIARDDTGKNMASQWTDFEIMR